MSDEPLRLLFDNSPDAMVIADDDGRYVDVNEPACRLFGYTRAQLLVMHVGDLAPPDTAAVAEQYREYLVTGRETGDFTFVRADQQVRIASYTACRIAPNRHISILRDVTEARLAEKQLRETERQRTYVLASAQCLLWYADVTNSDHPTQLYWDARFVDVEAAQQFLELDMQPGESYQSARRRARLLEDREACDRIGTDAIRAGKNYAQEFRCRAADGSIHWLHEDVHVETVVEGKQWRVVGVCTDITAWKAGEEERERLNQALKESAAWYRILADAMPQIVWTARPDGSLDYYNARWYEFSGVPREEAGADSWEAVVYPEDVRRCHATWYESVRTGAPYQIEFRFKDRGPENYRWFLGRAVPVRDEKGEIVKWFGSWTDIDDQKKAEMEIAALNMRLRRSVQETHHRVKNNLQVISALVELQAEDGRETVPVSAIERIGKHARALAAIHDLLTHQAGSDASTDTISTREALDRLIALLQATTGGRRIHHHADDVILPVWAGGSLALLVSEIVSNSVKHGRGDIGLKLTVESESVRLEVWDDGPGFPADFDWRTAANTGLSLIDSAARFDLRGTIAYENRPEGGARVVVTFPMAAVQLP